MARSSRGAARVPPSALASIPTRSTATASVSKRFARSSRCERKPRKGSLSDDKRSIVLADTDQLFKAYEYEPLVVAGHPGAPVRLKDIATVTDSVEDVRNLGLSFGEPSVISPCSASPAREHDRNRRSHHRDSSGTPRLDLSSLHLRVAMDRTTTIRASIHDVEITLLISSRSSSWSYSFSFVTFGPPLFPALPSRSLSSHIRRHVPVRLQPRQSFPHGAHHLDGLRRGRRHCRHRKYRPPHRGRDETIRRHHAGRERNWLHCSLHERFASRRLHPILLFPGIVGRLFREFAVTLTVAIAVSMSFHSLPRP